MEGKTVATADLRVFRTYDWLLNQQQREARERWFDISLQALGSAPSKMILDGSSAGSGTSSEALVAVDPSCKKLKPVSKDLTLVKEVKNSSCSGVSSLKKKLQQVQKDGKGDVDVSSLMKFFVAKGKAS